MTTKERLHQLIEELPDSDLEVVERFLEAAREAASDGSSDPVEWALDRAPAGEAEPDEVEAIQAAKARIAAGGKVIPHDEARRRLLGHP